MKKTETIIETIAHLAKVRKKHKTIGFVPTMGALHAGHLSLIKEAKKNNDYVVCSIFVNPIQFNSKTDLLKYPRNLDMDTRMLESVNCDFLFYPSEYEMYPEPVNEKHDFSNLDKVMEGKFRPGHFQGVAIVVKKLFEIIQPDKAYFGLKDFQQFAIIKKMVTDLKMPVEIIACPTIRENDGLALSSRNQLLEPSDRENAPVIYQTLKNIQSRAGTEPISKMKNDVENIFKQVKNTRLEYFEIVDILTLQPLQSWSESRKAIACIAVYYGNVRLIDNIILFS